MGGGADIIVLDLETRRSASDCRHCEQEEAVHYRGGACVPWTGEKYSPLGWESPTDLGLSIGCYYDYQDGVYHWFDAYTLEATMRAFVERQALLVSFNGIGFDFRLMRGLLRREAERVIDVGRAVDLRSLCDGFKALCADSYDILAEIWRADPARKFERGLNSLDAISQANGYGGKEMDGAQAPRCWRAGRYAEVLEYCRGDVTKTKALFEQIVATGELRRGDGCTIGLAAPRVGVSVG